MSIPSIITAYGGGTKRRISLAVSTAARDRSGPRGISPDRMERGARRVPCRDMGLEVRAPGPGRMAQERIASACAPGRRGIVLGVVPRAWVCERLRPLPALARAPDPTPPLFQEAATREERRTLFTVIYKLSQSRSVEVGGCVLQSRLRGGDAAMKVRLRPCRREVQFGKMQGQMEL